MPDHILKRTGDPAVVPVTVAECKTDLRVQHTAEDALIADLIAEATDYVDVPDGVVSKALITQTWTLSVRGPVDGKISIPVTPVQSISSITYYDSDNVQKNLAVSDVSLYGDDYWAFLKPKPDMDWPSVYDRLDAITITFIAGYGDAAASVPRSIRRLIRLIVAHWYENRSATTDRNLKEMPLSVKSLVAINRKGWVY